MFAARELEPAFTVSYAVYRAASRIADAYIRGSLEADAVALLRAAGEGDGGQVIRRLGTLRALLLFAGEVGVLHGDTVRLLERELQRLRDAVEARAAREPAEDEEVKRIFADAQLRRNASISERLVSARDARDTGNAHDSATPISDAAPGASIRPLTFAIQNRNPAKSANQAISASAANPATRNDEPFPEIIQAEERRNSILSLVRNLSLCRLKDVVNALPGVSERTVRYDLSYLIDRGFVERLGEGGPNTYYRPRFL